MNSLTRRFNAGLAAGAMFFAALPAVAVEGVVDLIATPAYWKSMQTLEMMGKIDANGDHVVSIEEGTAYFGKLFDTLDRNHDGVLDRTEWVGAANDADVIGLSTGGYARALGSMDMMAMVDKDGDHSVSRQEFLAAHKALFDKMAGGQSSAIDTRHWLANHFPK